ncbi:MAG: hypothetical protein AB1351_08980 [Thermoproteota archaeon]
MRCSINRRNSIKRIRVVEGNDSRNSSGTKLVAASPVTLIVGLDAKVADCWLYACRLSIAKNAPAVVETAIAEMIAIACNLLPVKYSLKRPKLTVYLTNYPNGSRMSLWVPFSAKQGT